MEPRPGQASQHPGDGVSQAHLEGCDRRDDEVRRRTAVRMGPLLAPLRDHEGDVPRLDAGEDALRPRTGRHRGIRGRPPHPPGGPRGSQHLRRAVELARPMRRRVREGLRRPDPEEMDLRGLRPDKERRPREARPRRHRRPPYSAGGLRAEHLPDAAPRREPRRLLRRAGPAPDGEEHVSGDGRARPGDIRLPAGAGRQAGRPRRRERRRPGDLRHLRPLDERRVEFPRSAYDRDHEEGAADRRGDRERDGQGDGQEGREAPHEGMGMRTREEGLRSRHVRLPDGDRRDRGGDGR